jgi:rhodanese-related sulfurtransferase
VTLLLSPAAAAAAGDEQAAKDPQNHTWVAEGVLAIGGGGLTVEQADWLHAEGFRAIADLRSEHADPAEHITALGMTLLDMPIDSAADINATQLASFVAWAKEQEAAGRPIYIHCTNGWHRAAAFVVAWDMASNGKDYDDAAREAVARRDGTVMRSVAALLDYQAELRGTPALAVTLVSATTHPGLDGTMEAHVDVLAAGAPAAGANVRVWSEESRLGIEGVTDIAGRFTFTYRAPASAFMDHLYARASLDGHLDGGDNVEFVFGTPAKIRGPLDVVAQETTEGLHVRVTSAGRPVAARVVVAAEGYVAFEASAFGEVTLRDAPRGVDLDIRAISWGSEGGRASARLAPSPAPPPEASAPGEPAAPTPDPPASAPADLAPSDRVSGKTFALRYAAAGVAGALGLLASCAVFAAWRRSGLGDR